MMDLTIDLAEAQSDNDCDEPAPKKGQFKRARSCNVNNPCAAIHPKQQRSTRVMTFSSLPHDLIFSYQ